MAEHTCHARGCEASVPPRMFMCKPHWSSLPGVLRKAVLDAYRPGQERRRDPSRAYLEAARNARDWLSREESGREAAAAGGVVEVWSHGRWRSGVLEKFAKSGKFAWVVLDEPIPATVDRGKGAITAVYVRVGDLRRSRGRSEV